MILKTFLILFAIFELVSCTDKNYDKEKSNDFSFIIKDETDSYDSKSCIYKRQYSTSDSSIRVEFSKDELLSIYELFKKYDFLSFPEEFECAKMGAIMLPAFTTTIEITYKGKTKKVTNTSYCSNKVEKRKSRNFYKLSSEIIKIIYSKDQVKNMRPCDIIFL